MCNRNPILSEIREALHLKYRDKVSCINPIVEDVVKLDIAKNDFIVSPEAAAFQKACDPSVETGYVPRDIVDIEDVIVKEVDFTLPKTAQSFERNRLIHISGAGGHGKTTQMLQLALDWCAGRSPILSQFELLFYISLQQNICATNTETLVCDEIQILPTALKEKLKVVLENKTSQCKHLYIIDGYEAAQRNTLIKSLIDGDIDPDATVIVCGRPYWMKDVKSKRGPDIIVDIKGISEKNVEQLCLNLLGGDKGSVGELMDICKKYIMDSTLMRNPLFSILCCYLFHATHAMKLQVCNHVRPTSITELFNAILRLLLMIYSKRMAKEFPVNFNRSPFDESGGDIPGSILRLVFQISKLSFEGIKKHKDSFTAKDLKAFFIEPDELCQLGIMMCTSKKIGQFDRNLSHFTFKFRHKMFQEYMAGLYMANEASAMDEIFETVLQPARKVSEDAGYCSVTEDPPPKETKTQKKKKHRFPLIKWPKKKSEYDLCKQEPTMFHHLQDDITTNWLKLIKKRHPQEHLCSESGGSSLELNLQMPTEEEGFNLDVADVNTARETSGFVDGGISGLPHPLSFRTLPAPVTQKCLYNLLHPFQTAVIFACGANPIFTKRLLERCNQFSLAKVCKWNNNKFDVGYEAAMFCESQEPSLALDFFKFFRSKDKQDKAPTSIQFPSPYDEYATCVLAQSMSEVHAKNLLHHWYDVDLLTSPLSGANIVYSDSDMLELNDPCLFEMLLLHKFCHVGVTSLRVTGNYFPGFPELSVAFPNVRELYFDGVNIPSPPQNYNRGEDEELKFIKLNHLKLVNVHASFPFCRDLVQVLKKSPELKTLVLQKINCDDRKKELLSKIKEQTSLQELSLVKMNLCYEDFVHSAAEVSSEATVTDILGALSGLTSLDLGYNNISTAITALVLALREHKLSRLILRKCRIPKISLASVGPVLTTFSYLEHLDMSCNAVSDKLANLLLWLSGCSNLQALELRNCSLCPDNFLAACNVMQGIKQLILLDVSHNNLSSAAKMFLLKLPHTMKKLMLSNCNLLSMDAIGLAPAMRAMPNIENIDLQDNPINGGVEPIMLALKHCKHLSVLNLRHCQLKPSHFLVIAKQLPLYHNLSELTIGTNTCCDGTNDARGDLVKSLLKCKHLQCLRCFVLNGEPFSGAQVEQLKCNIKEVTIFKHSRQA